MEPHGFERVALVLSPKSRRFVYVAAAYAENLESVSRDAKTVTMIRQDDRSVARSYQGSRRWVFAYRVILALGASFFMLKITGRVSSIPGRSGSPGDAPALSIRYGSGKHGFCASFTRTDFWL